MLYSHREALYHGPHSSIFKATNASGGLLALKVVDIDLCLKPHDVKHEIALVEKLSHPNVLPYLDLYEDGDDWVLVTPLYQFDLLQLIRHYSKKQTKFDLTSAPTVVHKNCFPADVARNTALGLARALAYLHSQGIIHRDVKPGNVYFASPDSQPVLGDFGIAYESGVSEEDPEDKVLDICSGAYKPPEVCFGVSSYGPEVDMWSYGVVLTALYSRDGQPAVTLGGSDMSLVHSLFQTFGTPSLDPADLLFWPTMASDKYHFQAFHFDKHPAKLPQQIAPQCHDQAVLGALTATTVYEATRRALAASVVALLTQTTCSSPPRVASPGASPDR